MTPEIRLWAQRHGVSNAALADLAETLGLIGGGEPGGSESRAQSEIRLAAPSLGMRLFRNNVGALKDDRGVPVRYGLANDTPQLNKRLKSSDLVGWRRVHIGPEHVGAVLAQFTAIECKAPGWRYGGDDHEQAQARWGALVASDGGFFRFATGAQALA